MALKLRYDVFGSEILGSARFAGKYEFPVTPGIRLDALPGRIVPFDRAASSLRPGDWLHGYVHDVRFYRFLSSAEKSYLKIDAAAGYIGADNSMYRDLPIAEQIHSCYLNRAIDYYLHSKGKPVVQNVSWGGWRSYDFCCDGVPENSTIAVSSYGCCRSVVEKSRFEDGFLFVVGRLRPYSVMIHGSVWPRLEEIAGCRGVSIIRIPTWRNIRLAVHGESQRAV